MMKKEVDGRVGGRRNNMGYQNSNIYSQRQCNYILTNIVQISLNSRSERKSKYSVPASTEALDQTSS